jgi:hypothetical protein
MAMLQLHPMVGFNISNVELGNQLVTAYLTATYSNSNFQQICDTVILCSIVAIAAMSECDVPLV